MRRILDALRFAAAIVTWPISRRAVQARGNEDRRQLPGDELLPSAKGRWTNAISIRARPGEVWPWLVQLGCRRAGWYSYDGLDNGGVPSAERIVPELQQVEVGDLFPWTPDANDGFIVKAVEPERVLVLGGDAGTLYRVAWAFVLEPIDDSHTRLLTRSSADYERPSVGLRLRLVAHPMHFAMQRRQLLNLKQRAERFADRNPEPGAAPEVRRAPAGASGDLLRDERGMLRCLSGKRPGSARDGGRGSRRAAGS
jgi:hypothetical protein